MGTLESDTASIISPHSRAAEYPVSQEIHTWRHVGQRPLARSTYVTTELHTGSCSVQLPTELKAYCVMVVVAHAFNNSTWEADEVRKDSSIWCVPVGHNR